MAWLDTICFNTEIPGCGRVGAKLSFLEGVAALCAVLADPPSVMAKVATIHTVNLGFVLAWRKGSSRCHLTYSILLALKALERALYMRLELVKFPTALHLNLRLRTCSQKVSSGRFGTSFLTEDQNQAATVAHF